MHRVSAARRTAMGFAVKRYSGSVAVLVLDPVAELATRQHPNPLTIDPG